MRITLSLVSTIALVFALAIPSGSIAQELDSDLSPKFRPRTDVHAIADLDALREVLSKSADSRGPINPLGDYIPSQSRTDRGAASTDDRSNAANASNLESNPPPSLDRKNKQTTAPEINSVTLLPPPRLTIVQNTPTRLVTSVASDGFAPTQIIRLPVADRESTIRPALDSPVQYASAPGLTPGNVVTANYQDPTASSVPFLPSSPTNSIPLQSTPSGSFPATSGSTGAVGPGAIMPAPPVYNVPDSSAATTPFFPNQNQVIGQNGQVTQPFYPPNSIPQGRVVSPNTLNPPTYSRPTGVVNSLPFVSNPPNQFDARNMVSPTVFRQSCDSPNAPGRPVASNPYLGGSPFAYAPPAAMPMQPRFYSGSLRPLIGFGQNIYEAQLGRGIIGQPTAYVDGQPVRNLLRYIAP